MSMPNDYNHTLVIEVEVEVDLAEFDEICTIWKKKNRFLGFETQWLICYACSVL